MPPVTAERSPPASRMTGADSPVIADSSTDATPSMISPSEGTNSLADTTTTSPARKFELGIFSISPSSRSRLAIVSDRALRSVSACALPRPSAIASAKLANSTVNQSHNVICRLKAKSPRPRNNSTVVMTLPTSTTNITGLPIMWRGSSLTKESRIARQTILPSQTALFLSGRLSKAYHMRLRSDFGFHCAALNSFVSVYRCPVERPFRAALGAVFFLCRRGDRFDLRGDGILLHPQDAARRSAPPR